MKIQKQSSTPPFGVCEKDIQVRAYYLWLEQGCPTGRELDHWREAVAQIPHQQPTLLRRLGKNCASVAKKRGARVETIR